MRIVQGLDIVLKYKPLWYIIMAALLAVGFNFKTPAQHFNEIAREQAQLHASDTLLQNQIDELEIDHTQIRVYIRALVTAECLDRSRRETVLMGLNCTQLLEERRAR